MLHPDPIGPAATQPWRVGDELWNPVTRERAVLLETPLDNALGRARAEMTALVGARVLGEHLHPGLVERFTVLEGQLTVRRDGETSKLREGETAKIRAGQWHDWWNAEDHDARVIQGPRQIDEMWSPPSRRTARTRSSPGRRAHTPGSVRRHDAARI